VAFIKEDESPWVLGAVANNIWSLGGSPGSSDRTNQLLRMQGDGIRCLKRRQHLLQVGAQTRDPERRSGKYSLSLSSASHARGE
jgi:hypothetical protein